MGRVRSKDTGAEMVVRRIAHKLGYRYRLHQKTLPGSPDMVFPSRKQIVFIHGCFWHRHDCARGNRFPKTNSDYWRSKLDGNKIRDRRNEIMLKELGWSILVVWECETRDAQSLPQRLAGFLELSGV